MPRAFVLVNVEPGTEAEVEEQLRKVKNIKELFHIYGGCDLLAKVEASISEELESCAKDIRWLDKVKSTLTLTVAE